jgi:hypothetical protein
MCTRAVIRVIIQYQQEYQHHYFREDEPNSLVNVAGEPRVRFTIVEEVAVRIDIVRTNLLVTTNINHPRLIRRNKIQKTIPKKL